MYLIKPITKKCRTVFENEVPPEMLRGRDLVMEFRLLHETLEALRQAGLIKEKDYRVD